MTMNDPLASALSKVLNSEKIARKECVVKPCSKVIKSTLDVMNKHRYIGDYEEVQDAKGNLLQINLIGKINKCGVIKPRFAVNTVSINKYIKRYLPAQDFGIIILSTSQGIMSHQEAKEKGIGGKLIAYCY